MASLSHLDRAAAPCFVLLALAAHALAAAGLTTDEAIKRFKDANDLYDQGEAAAAAQKPAQARKLFQQAVAQYEAILDAGHHNGQIFFNLGNAYYRLGKIGKAIANYLRAQRLMPRSASVEENLRQALRLAEDKTATRRVPELVSVMFFWYFLLNFDELLVATLVAYTVLAGLLLIMIFKRRVWLKHMSLWCGVIFAVLAVSLAAKFQRDVLTQRGVVTAKEVTVRYGNGAHYTVKFTVHEGAQCVLLDEQPDGDGRPWLKATFLVEMRKTGEDEAAPAEQRTGWVPASAVETLAWRAHNAGAGAGGGKS